jgi:predicted DNA-binding protein YlxM (UPF0122 family)
MFMLEKKLRIGRLNDIYGGLLTEHQRELIRLYYDCDISLFELSEQFGISRQAVRDAVSRGEKLLMQFEEELRLAEKTDKIRTLAEEGKAAPGDERHMYFSAITDILES